MSDQDAADHVLGEEKSNENVMMTSNIFAKSTWDGNSLPTDASQGHPRSNVEAWEQGLHVSIRLVTSEFDATPRSNFSDRVELCGRLC